MQIFLDTADLNEIKYFVDLGIIDGITTNPSLLSGPNYKKILKEICSIMQPGPVSAEVIATDFDGMMKEALTLKQIADNIVIKLPLTADGLKACSELSADDIHVNMTLCFSAAQALLATKAGATFVSVFVGRQDDIGHDGMHIIDEIVQMYKHGADARLLVASIRHPVHVVKAARLGADACTVPPKVLKQMIAHPMTEQGLAKFLADWRNAETVK